MKYWTILLVLVLVASCTVEQAKTPSGVPDIKGEKEPVVNEVPKVPTETAPTETVPETPQEKPTEVKEGASPIEDGKEYAIDLIASVEDGVPTLIWTKYDNDFKMYKVVRSVTTSTPTYPTDDLMKTVGSVDEITYTDPSPAGGISYYRVVAVNSVGQKTESNIVMVELPNTKETPGMELNLKAEKTDKGVQLTWTPYTEGKLMYYKVEWTNKHPFPKYPDDSTLATIPFVNQTTHLHMMPEKGDNYYAVTVVRSDKTRYTSNVVKMTV